MDYNEEELKNNLNANCGRKYQQCSLTVMDTIADPDITFDTDGVCNYVNEYKHVAEKFIYNGDTGLRKLEEQIVKIKHEGKSNSYDCIVGVSGGIDSTYVAYLTKKYGLKPLVVHFDNGWNSELAVKNIENIISKLEFDLYTYVVNWNEFRDLQRAYFKASVIDIEAITDHAILATVHKIARQKKIKYIISGSNFATEGILPSCWVHDKSDWLNIKSIHQKFGTIPLKTYPRLTFQKIMYYQFTKTLSSFNILNYIDYNKVAAQKIITKELGWRDYGGKHHESIFTRFYQSYVLPVKFHVDKRKAHLSTLICSGQLTKQEAMAELQQPICDPQLLNDDKAFVLKKLGFTEDEFNKIMYEPQVPHKLYPNYAEKYWKYYYKVLKKYKSIKSKKLL